MSWLVIVALLAAWVILSGNEDCRRNTEEWEEYWRWRELDEARRIELAKEEER